MSAFAPYVEAWRQRWARQKEADREAAARARAVLPGLVEILRDRYGARRVVLVGSLARGGFRAGSDIDLAAEGIPDDAFFRAGADLEAAAGGIHVDLVPLEAADPEYLAHLCADGELLHDSRGR